MKEEDFSQKGISDYNSLKVTPLLHLIFQNSFQNFLQKKNHLFHTENKKKILKTCLMPWKAQSQKSNRPQRNDAWNTESNIPGTQLFTRKLRGNNGSIEKKTIMKTIRLV